jgi:hypothetical protein
LLELTIVTYARAGVTNVSSDFSFLPGLAPLLGHPLVRREPLQ